MAVTVIQRGIRGFFSEIVGFVVRFVLSERIARWIADQGGWVSESVSWFSSRVILTCKIDIAILSVCPSVRASVCYVPVFYENGLTYCHSFFTTW